MLLSSRPTHRHFPSTALLRRFIACILSGITFSILAAEPTSASFQQVPGFYQQVIGPLQVTALFDGVVFLPRGYMKDIGEADLKSLLDSSYVPERPKGLQTAVNAYLVRQGGHLTLVDAGTADCFGPDLGQVLDNLRSAGQRPEDVETVLLTHAHPDHLCGLLTKNGGMAYPDATVWLSAEDAGYWLSTDAQQAAPEAMRGLFDMARRALSPYEAAGKLKRFSGDGVLPSGVVAVPSHGHTPGHTSWLFNGGSDQSLLIWGDIVHYHAVQFARPTVSFEYDSDRKQAIASRMAILARAASSGWWVAGAHLPFPGLGHIRTEGSSYRWVPVEFSPTSIVGGQ
mgnify:CR=1 FL=1